MKIFISWSGVLSRQIACVFKDWLPFVIQSVKPYVSSEDIDKGTRWSSDIASELELSNYGIIVITKDNLNAPWINFEAGALSKSLESSNVSPFLFNIKRSEVQGPLLQFQSTLFEKSEVLKLIQSINRRLEEDRKVDENQLVKAFEVWWSELETKLKSVKDEIKDEISEENKTKDKNKDNQSEILEEILELVRSQQKILNSPEFISKNPSDRVVNAIAESYMMLLHQLRNKHVILLFLIDEVKKNVDELLTENISDNASDLQAGINRLFQEIQDLGAQLKLYEKIKFDLPRDQNNSRDFLRIVRDKYFNL